MPNQELDGDRCQEIRENIRETERQRLIKIDEERILRSQLDRARAIRNQKNQELTRLKTTQAGADIGSLGTGRGSNPIGGALGVLSAGLGVKIRALEGTIADLDSDIFVFQEQIRSKQRKIDEFNDSLRELSAEGKKLNCVL